MRQGNFLILPISFDCRSGGSQRREGRPGAKPVRNRTEPEKGQETGASLSAAAQAPRAHDKAQPEQRQRAGLRDDGAIANIFRAQREIHPFSGWVVDLPDNVRRWRRRADGEDHSLPRIPGTQHEGVPQPYGGVPCFDGSPR